MKVVCASDTHNFHDYIKFPEGDLLILAGDITGYGTEEELKELNNFLGSLPYKHIILIAGNHDFIFERSPERVKKILTNAIYLMDEARIIDDVKIYGTPWTPLFGDIRWAFCVPENMSLKHKFDKIPTDVDILVTHTPPYGILDKNVEGENCGSVYLKKRIDKIKPPFHVFGHIHEEYGVRKIEGTVYINASILSRKFYPVNVPISFHI